MGRGLHGSDPESVDVVERKSTTGGSTPPQVEEQSVPPVFFFVRLTGHMTPAHLIKAAFHAAAAQPAGIGPTVPGGGGEDGGNQGAR